jgi:EAL domain-containing protein (putative c-di-GMP-specific phosphodiesterase class I)
VVTQFRESSVAPTQVCFEITETAAISNLVHARRFISTLKEQVCRFALDDFGSGLSSFGYLQTLPVDYITINGRFVRDIATNPIDRALVESIHRIATVMGMETIAQWVESEATLNILKDLGVNYAQGYALGRPNPLGP